MKWLICTGCLKVQGNSKAVEKCERPKCSAFKFGKGNHLPNRVNKIKINPMKEQDLKRYFLMPGNMVSTYHYISWAICRLYHTKGM